MRRFAGKATKVLIVSAVMTACLAVSALAADIGIGVGATTGSSLRLRSEPNTSSTTVTYLDKGVAVSILAKLDGWYKVSFEGYTGYVSADYLVEDQDGVFTSYGRVNSDGVNVRAAASTDSGVAATLSKDTYLTVNGFTDGWYSVTCKYGTTGYVRSDFVDLTTDSSSGSEMGKNVVATAKQYLGTRYVYGGASPSGFDCSGFTMYVYQQYGYSLPHTATGQWQSSTGTKVSRSDIQPGDLVFFCDPSRSNGKACSHAGIYIGDGQFIHSSSSRCGGVIISSLYDDYYNTYYVGAKRLG